MALDYQRRAASTATMRLAPLLALLLSVDALPSQRRIPDILAAIERRDELRKEQQENGRPAWPVPELALTMRGFEFAAASEFGAFPTDVEELRFRQRLDHFSREADEHVVTFGQKYFYTSRFVDGDVAGSEKALAFLCVGGEGPSLDASVLVDSDHCTGDMIELAKRLHEERGLDVHLFALEHRFYGESFPEPVDRREKEVKGGDARLRGADSGADAEGENENEAEDEQDKEDEAEEDFEPNLTHLSSRQAIKDIVAFVQSDDVAKKTRGDATWIAFGGSYPGMLSAWSHLLHPSSIFASVSSSAPVEVQLDFEEYNEVVGRDLADPSIGGSDLCQHIFMEGHEQAAAAIEGRGDAAEETEEERSGEEENGLERVANMFDVCGGARRLRESPRNVEIFLGDGLLGIPAQSNDPSCDRDLCNIQKICDAITGERTDNPDISSMEILANVKKMQSDYCVNADWKAYLDWFRTAVRGNANTRSWMYQTCTEFGFYQTCNEDSECPYGKGYHDVSQDLELCQEVFGIDPDEVRKNVDSTLGYYGGWTLTPDPSAQEVGPHATSLLRNGERQEEAGEKRILFVTGTVDPWTALAVTGSRGNDDHPSVSVEGSSHHFWTHEVKDSDGEAIEDARKTIFATVEGWLGLTSERGAGIVATE